MEGTGLRARRIARKDPQNLGRQEESAGRNAGPHLAHAKRGQYRTISGDVVPYEGLECLTEAVNCLRRFKSEAVGQLFVRRGDPGLGLIYEGLAEAFFQNAPPIKLIAHDLADRRDNKPKHLISIAKGQAEAPSRPHRRQTLASQGCFSRGSPAGR